jgi:hypothetical protein
MSNKIFITKNLDEYRNHPDIRAALNGISLLNYDEFMNWYQPTQIKFGERANRLAATLSSRLPEIDTVHQISKENMRILAEEVCEKKIGRDYGRRAIDRLSNDGFDVLIAVAPRHEELNLPSRTKTGTKAHSNKKIKHILGFIIAEKGECKKHPDEYCVNLICSREKLIHTKFSIHDPRQRAKGALIMGAYLYCLKKLGKEMGILELADCYQNIAGFISYTKMGFAVDHSLYGENCFRHCENLPMSISLAHITYDNIIGRASGRAPLSREELEEIDPTGLSLLIPRNPEQASLQKKIAVLCNVLYKLPRIFEKTCKLHPIDEAAEFDILNTVKQISKDQKEAARQEALQEELNDSTVRKSRRTILHKINETVEMEPTLEELMAILTYFKQVTMAQFHEAQFNEAQFNEAQFQENAVEEMVPEPVVSEQVSASANKTKRKRSSSASGSTGSKNSTSFKRMRARSSRRSSSRSASQSASRSILMIP